MTTITRSRAASMLSTLKLFASDIKIIHSIFAIPFAAAAFFLGNLPWPTPRQIILLLFCMITARSTAMGMNRYLDRNIDRENPRTRNRKIPSGELSAGAGLGWSLASAAIFVGCAVSLSPLAGYCALPLLVILSFYSLMKRVSILTHWYLGMCLGLAPVAVSIAMIGTVHWAVLLIGASVCLWTAGFDIIYALQDQGFDRSRGLHSIPSRYTPAVSINISRFCFLSMIVMLTCAGWLADSGRIYYFGVAAIAILLAYEHFLIRDAKQTGQSNNLNVAFFNMNAYISIIYLAFTVLDALVR